MIILGIDEAGRGPLSGPVVAAGVILDQDKIIDGLADSKKLTEKKTSITLSANNNSRKGLHNS